MTSTVVGKSRFGMPCNHKNGELHLMAGLAVVHLMAGLAVVGPGRTFLFCEYSMNMNDLAM